MNIFTDNFLHELPTDIQIYIMKLSKTKKCNIVYNFKNNDICFINLITKEINDKILNFKYILKDIEYDIEDEKYKYFYDKYLYFYHLQVYYALQEYINNIVLNYPINIIRKIMFNNLDNKEIEELFKERYHMHYNKIKQKKGCYIRTYYALMLGTAYCYYWNMQKVI